MGPSSGSGLMSWVPILVIFSSSSFLVEVENVEFENPCFCELQGRIDDCSCTVESVDHFNNMKIFPRLMSVLNKDYFRYFRYNSKKSCLFWNSTSEKCSSLNCRVSPCKPEELPKGIIFQDSEHPSCQGGKRCSPRCEAEEEDLVDSTISDQVRSNLLAWKAHDESVTYFCDIDEELCPDCDYVDLGRNPERFTGFRGESANRIWRAIYQENCFKPPPSNSTGAYLFINEISLSEMCLEKRAFFRAISGLHTSITIHLCANYPLSKDSGDPLRNKPVWGPNLKEFVKRFDPASTNDQGPYWLKNLYFVYLLELRALTKGLPYFQKQTFYTGNEEEDKDTQVAVKEIMNLLRSFQSETFNESSMFSSAGTASLKYEFQKHFHNITHIMDCVTCDKCKLWGKLQITGLGTALKILFSNIQSPYFYLSRNEIVALFNAFGRISTSIQQVENFRQMLKNNL